MIQEEEEESKREEVGEESIVEGTGEQQFYSCLMEDEIEDQRLLNVTLKEKIQLMERST